MTDSGTPEPGQVEPGSTKNAVKMKLIEDTDRVVIVLGAGASISEMLEHESTGSMPPTDLNFLERAKEVCQKEFGKFKSLYDQVWRDGEPYPLKYQRMEQVFASIFWQVQQTNGKTKGGRLARELFDSLVILLRNTIEITTKVPSPTQHTQLFREVKNRAQKLSIIDLNYDVIADRALRNGHNAGSWFWNYANAYGFTPRGRSKPRRTSDIEILKLHGSMHWYIPLKGKYRKTAYNPNSKVYVPKPATRGASPAWQRRQKKMGHTNQNVFPLLVPPIYEKGTQIHGIFNDIWRLAETTLADATLVIVWGYSLPITDYHTEVLFARSARKSKSRLIVINPDPAALGRVTYVCGHRWNRWFFRIDHLFTALDNGE